MKTPTSTERRKISVQGVGFRPFLFSLAQRHGLSGLVHNDAGGVHVEVEGSPEKLDRFLRGIQEEAPPLAVVEAVTWSQLPVQGARAFRIEESKSGTGRMALISPDVATCAVCLRELFDPHRHGERFRMP